MPIVFNSSTELLTVFFLLIFVLQFIAQHYLEITRALFMFYAVKSGQDDISGSDSPAHLLFLINETIKSSDS